MITMSVASTEYVKVVVSATKLGQIIDPTADVVQMAFTSTTPQVGDWQTASWESTGVIYLARCLVGPSGTVTLAPGTYNVWVKVTDSPEVPVKNAGQLTVVA